MSGEAQCSASTLSNGVTSKQGKRPIAMELAAISLDLDDTLWPIQPVIDRADQRLHDWLVQNCPRAAAAWPIAEMRALRERVASENPTIAHDFSAQRRMSLLCALQPHGYDETHVENAFAAFSRARNEVDCFADVVPGLERLAKRYTLISLSNGNADLQHIGLARYFSFSVSAREFGMAKPAPQIFLAACARLGLSPTQVLHVGDDPHLDVVAARAAGLRSAWINRTGAVWNQPQSPDFSVRDLHELADSLDAFGHVGTKSQ